MSTQPRVVVPPRPPALATAANPATAAGRARRPSTRRGTALAGAALAAVGLALAGCGGGGGGSSSSPATSATSAAAAAAGASSSGGVTVSSRTGSLGTYLTDGTGRTLYDFAADHHDHSVCYGSCATYWPPLMATAKPHAAGGVRAALLGLTTRQGGGHQVTYAGRPLYYYAGDHGVGTTSGQGLNVSGGLWWLVSPAGASITAKAGATASSSPAGGGGYGGGY